MRPVEGRTLADIGDIIAVLGPHFMAGEREANEQAERDCSGWPAKADKV